MFVKGEKSKRPAPSNVATKIFREWVSLGDVFSPGAVSSTLEGAELAIDHLSS